MSRFSMRVILQIFGLLSILFVAHPAEATKSKWMSGFLTTGNTGAQAFGLPLGHNQALTTTEGDAQCIAPTGGTVGNLLVVVSAAPNNGGGSQTWTTAFRIAAMDTAVSCVITEDETSCPDTDTVAVAAGDLISVGVTPANTPTAASISWLLEFNSTTSGETVLCGNVAATNLASTTTYGSLMGSVAANATETTRWFPAPSDGTIKKLYVDLATDPSAGDTRVFTVFKEASGTGAPTVTFSAGETGIKSDTSTELAVVAGNSLSLQHAPTGTPTASRARWGVVFVPATVGDFILATSGAATNFDQANPTYLSMTGSGSSTVSAATVAALAHTDFTIKAIYAELNGVPGAGNDYIFELQENGSDASTPFTCTINGGAATTCNASGTFTPASGGKLNVEVTPVSTPTARQGAAAWLGNMAVAATGPPLGGFSLLGVGR